MQIHNSLDYLATGSKKGTFTLYKLKTEIDTMTTHQFTKPITAIYTTNEFTIIGMLDLIFYNIQTQEYELITKFTLPITSLFLRGQMLYSASEEATIRIFLIGKNSERNKKVENKTSHEKIVDLKYSFKQIEEIIHTAPILNVVGDGEKTYYLDVKGRIVVYPTKESYDILSSSIELKNYLFATEKNFIYCKTKEAFAVVINTDFLIRKITFSEEGGILFIKGDEKIVIYNINTREPIDEIETKCENMVFDEKNNRIVLFNKNEKMEIINGVLNDNSILYEQIEEIKFEANKIIPKIVNEKENFIYELGSESDDECIQRIKRSKKKLETKEIFHEKIKSGGHHLNGDALNLFEDGESSESIRGYSEKEFVYEQQIFIPCYVKRNKTYLLCWNDIGYLMKREGDLGNVINLKFHNNGMMDKRISDVDGCIFGWFSKSGIVLGSRNMIKFISDRIEWTNSENPLKGEIVFLTMSDNFIICVTLRSCYTINILDLNGKPLFNFSISEFVSLCCNNKKIAVFHGRLKVSILEIDDFLMKQYELIYDPKLPFNFCFIENEKIYYGNIQSIYLLFNGMSIKVLDVEGGVPLGVIKDHVVSLSKIDGGRLEPQPQIEYYKMEIPTWLINNINCGGLRIEPCYYNTHDEDSSDNIPPHFREENNSNVLSRNETNPVIEYKQIAEDTQLTPAKKYNPFKKQ